ncbi:type II toxin-antitoxin system VapB family antitoxin [Nesterenkonia alkaliphila]|nr:hypothetical protein [Nesterenkonia alkaliphila]
MKRVDVHAAQLGLSRNEYLRRLITQRLPAAQPRTTVDDLQRSAERFKDALDSQVMDNAW